jgi:hypothetical protein
MAVLDCARDGRGLWGGDAGFVARRGRKELKLGPQAKCRDSAIDARNDAGLHRRGACRRLASRRAHRWAREQRYRDARSTCDVTAPARPAARSAAGTWGCDRTSGLTPCIARS